MARRPWKASLLALLLCAFLILESCESSARSFVFADSSHERQERDGQAEAEVK